MSGFAYFGQPYLAEGPPSSDGLTFTDSGTGGFTLAGSASELRIDIDAAAGAITFAGAASELRVGIDTGSGGFTATGAADELYGQGDVASGDFTLTGSAAELRIYLDGGSGGFSFSGASAESRAFVDGEAGAFVFAGTTTEVVARVDSGTGIITFSGAGIDDFTPGVAPVTITPIVTGGELRFQITTLRYPTVEPIVLAELQQFTGGQVGIPLNEGRDGQVTLDVYDPAYGAIVAHYDGMIDEYAAMLRVFYDGTCVLWAPITGASFKGADGTVTVTASDKVRLEHHEVVIGDEAISPANAFGGRIPVDYRGLRLLRDAAINLPGQTLRGVPDIGIADGSNDQPDSDVFIKIERGTQVWSAWTDLVSHGSSPGHEGAPDFEMPPTLDTPGAYVLLNTYVHQGQDKTGQLVFHHGWGRDNLAGFDSDPLGKIITHQHALGRNNKIRETRADLASSARRGLYVSWDAKDYTGSDADIRIALGAWAQQQVEAYSIPPRVVKITLKPEEEITDPLGRFRYLRDFIVGDEVHAESRTGYHRESTNGRIVKVTLNQQDGGRRALADLDLIPNVAGDGTATEDD